MTVAEPEVRLDPALVAGYLEVTGRRGGPRALERTVLRTRSRVGRDLLAAAAAPGLLRADELVAAVRAAGAGGQPPPLDLDWTLSLARVIGMQNLDESASGDAVLLLRELHRQHGSQLFDSPSAQQSVVERLWHAGERGLLREWLPQLRRLRPEVRRFLDADLANPFVQSADDPSDHEASGAARARWQGLVDAVFAEHGVEPVRVADGAATPFDGLHCEVSDAVTDGPLVTVIMPVFRPGPELVTSVRSICDQTWRNLEILIMDDASPPGHEQVLEQCAALDERVQVHRMDQNGGTYLARNAALDIAAGELVTVQDADDWSHPRRIELQARALLADPSTPATRSFCLRVSEDLVFTRPSYDTSQENASSLMFRREQALATVGYFDRSRKSADTEFRRRLELAAGALVTDLPAPLAIVRMAGGSLSRDDFTPGWHHVSRFVYRAAYERWHAWLGDGADPYLARFEARRRFAIPQRFQIDQAGIAERPPRYDVVLLGDWRHLGPAQRALLDEVGVLTAAGYRVGVAHRESYTQMTARRMPLRPELLDLVNAGTVDVVALDQVASVRLLVVRSPDLLQFAPAEPSTLDVEQVLVVADQAPAAPDGTGPRYTPAVCDATVRATFGVEPRWLPQSPALRALLADHVPVERLDPAGPTDVVDSTGAPRQGLQGERPVIGRRSEADAASAWPATARELLRAYPEDGSAQVRLLGSDQVPVQVLGRDERPASWLLTRAGASSLAAFVDQLDFYVYYPDPRSPETFEPDVARAVARGCVAILPLSFEPVFGDAALYAEPAAVQRLVRLLHADPQAYREHSEQGVRVLLARFGPQAYLARVAERIGAPGTGTTPDASGARTGESRGTTAAAREVVPRPAWSPPPGSARPALRVILTVTAAGGPRLGETLQRIREDEQLIGRPITVVHGPDVQADVEQAAVQHPSITVVAAQGASRAELAEAACEHLADAPERYVTIADLPRVRAIRSWSRALRRELDRLCAVPQLSGPLLVWTGQCSPQALALYLDRALADAPAAPSPEQDYLAALALLASSPRVEAIDPRGGDIDVSVWFAAKLSPQLPRPPWRYRVVLTRDRQPAAASEPMPLEQRVDNRGDVVFENLRARVPLQQAGDGNFVFTIEVDTTIEALRIRRRLRPSKGVLLGARTIAMPTGGDGTVVRYLVHAAGTRNTTFITSRTGSGPTQRLRWAATLVRKDLGSVRRRQGGRTMVALRLARLATRPLFAGRQIWLIGERADTAQDNGLHLFRHLRQAQPRRKVYYVIDRESPQRDRVAPLGNVVAHSSLRHQLLMLHADVLANAYSTRYLTPSSWPQDQYVQHLAPRIGALRVYLKHGVHLNPNAVKRGLSGYDLFLTVMRRESEALRAVSGYDRQIREIGMPRYDGLVPAPPSRTVLFMPTWRQYLVPRLSGRPNPGQITFEGSAYEQFVSGFLQSPRLHAMLEQHDFRLTFLPHYNMASAFDSSVRSAERISVADTNATSFQDLLRTCDAFITDYSSVHFDVAYLGTPVIYARFDEADYEAGHASRSWFDYDRDGYGPVTRDLDATLDALQEVLERGCTVPEPYASRVAGSFTFRDRENCARVAAAIDELSAARRRGIDPS